MVIENRDLYQLFVLLCATGLVLTLAGEYRVRAALTATGKVLAASAYIGAALSLGAWEGSYGQTLVAGMACCWLGDLLLVSRKVRAMFLAGLVAFLAGHLFYIAAFILRGTSGTAALVAAVPMFALALLVAGWLKPHLEARMVMPVRLYIGAITVMVVIAVGTFHLGGGWPLLAGAILFFISDLAVARNRFVAPGFINRAWGLPIYFSAQLLLAASAAV